MRKTSFFLILAACLLVGSYSVAACTCAEFDAPESFERSYGVFVGEVSETGGWFNPYVVLKVEKSWKSVDSDEVTLNVNNDCGKMDFHEGERYLVYSNEYEGDFYTSVCTRTNLISFAEQDLSFLESKSTIPLRNEFFTRNTRIGFGHLVGCFNISGNRVRIYEI
jgi:hypothetical protein